MAATGVPALVLPAAAEATILPKDPVQTLAHALIQSSYQTIVDSAHQGITSIISSGEEKRPYKADTADKDASGRQTCCLVGQQLCFALDESSALLSLGVG